MTEKGIEKGWISLYRKLQDNPLWTCERFTRGQAWVDLLLLANHEYSFFYKRSIKIEVQRGQVGRSEVELADRWKWSRTKVRNFLKDLENEQQIKQHKNGVQLLVTILNYEKFQDTKTAKRTAGEQQKNSKSTVGVQQENTYNNVNNINNVNNDNKSSALFYRDLSGDKVNGVSIPDELKEEGFKDAYTRYQGIVETKFKTVISDKETEIHFMDLLRLKKQGHNPSRVLLQSASGGNKALFALRENQFRETQNENNNGKGTEENERVNGKRRSSIIDKLGEFDMEESA